MPLVLSWQDILIRLALTVLAGSLIGLNRSEHGEAAGLRTTLLVCLAASVSMIQVNLLLATRGKPPDSFNVLDLMRLPLGILTGVGFIGGGAILRKGSLILGVTTAATLWFVTVIGLCLGGGQLGLGMTGLFLAILILWGLKHVEQHLLRDRYATLSIMLDAVAGPARDGIEAYLQKEGYEIIGSELDVTEGNRRRQWTFHLRWLTRQADAAPPSFTDELARTAGVLELRWKPQSV